MIAEPAETGRLERGTASFCSLGVPEPTDFTSNRLHAAHPSPKGRTACGSLVAPTLPFGGLTRIRSAGRMDRNVGVLMADTPNNAAAAGWYVDPITRQHVRWWNGQAWTESIAPLPGTAAPATPAAAPRVQQRFALGAADESTQAATAQTQAAASRFAPSSAPSQHQDAAQPFVTQVPVYAARTEPRREPEAPGHYMPQYGDALDLLKGTSLVRGSGGIDAAPAYHRSSAAPAQTIAATHTDVAADALGGAALYPQRQQPPHGELHPDLAFATPQQREDAARVAEEAHRAELARQEAARLEWDRQFQAQQAMAEELRLAQLRQVQEHASAVAANAEHTAAGDTTEQERAAQALEPTLMTRRQRRQMSESPTAAPTPDPAAFAPERSDEDDVWAGPDTRRGDSPTPQWSAVGRSRAAERQQAVPRNWGTISVWLLTLTPWLGAIAVFVVLALFDAWSLPALGVLALPWLIGLLWAQQDSARLADLGHRRPAKAGWALLTAPVYLIVRTVRVRRDVGRGWPPLLVWCAQAALVAAIVAALSLAPEALPAYAIETLDPLREKAAAWFGR